MKNVAIIGGGMAGLTAASILCKAHRVTLFEASDRLGGRAFTQTIAGDVMDWGCEALEAGDDAPTAVLKGYGTAVDEEPDTEDPQFRKFGDEGEGIDLGHAAADLMEANVEAATEHYKATVQMRRTSDERAAAYYKDVASKADDVTAGVNLSPGVSRMNALLCHLGSFSESSLLGTSSAFDRARCQLLQEQGGHEGGTVYFKEGLGAVVQAFANDRVVGKANVTIHRGRPITLIRNVHDGVLVVPQLREHGLGTVFDAVLVTVPTGIVSSGALTINDLTGEQMAAFRDCPLGHYHKVVVTGTGPLEHPPPNKRVYMCDENLEYAFFITGSPRGNYYMAHIAGEKAITCNGDHRWTEQTLVAMLQELNPGADLSGPLAFHHSDWHLNERIRGAYSYSVKGKGLARETLYRLTVGRIYFAGEACSLIWYGGLAGAMETAIDAATRMAVLLTG
jgi:monoamine oxidase